MSRPRFAIVSAMHEELRALLPLLDKRSAVILAGREFHLGELHGHGVVLVLAGIGKVAATVTATLLMHEFDASPVIFTGAAGGLADGMKVGDVVVARDLLQHDMDASPLFPRFEVPLTGRSRFGVDGELADSLVAATRRCLARVDRFIAPEHLVEFDIGLPQVHEGLIISGDRFICSQAQSDALRAVLPTALAVEMEGAAVAQACADFNRPFAVLRTISDRADDSATIDFNRFIDEVASAYTRAIVEDWLRHTPPH
jgi:adenosylhomocysteine nucleosidase